MEPVSNVDRLTLLLREKLAERAKATRGTPAGSARQIAEAGGIRALAAMGDVDERQFRRALVQSALVNHFGSRLMNEAGFQQVVEQVVAAIEADDSARELLGRAAAEARR